MVLSLRLYERIFSKETKHWQQKIIGIIKLEDKIKEFTFGRNEQTKELIYNINKYTFIAAEQGRFRQLSNGRSYLYTPLPSKPSFLKINFSLFGFRWDRKETMITDPTAITVGDKIIYKGDDKEFIIEIVRIY